MKRLCKTFILLILAAGIMVSGCKFQGMDILYKLLPGDKYVQTVKSGTMGNHKNVEVGKAFDQFFSDGAWHSFKSADGQRVVEFSGNANWKNKPANFKFQFIVQENTFQLHTIAINGIEQNMLVNAVILDKVLKEGQKENKAETTTLIPKDFTDNKQSQADEERFANSDKITVGKKVVVKAFSARVYSQPIGNNGKLVGEVEKFITLPYYNSVKVDGTTWYKVHIFDYGCGYVCADEAALLDDKDIIGNVVIKAMDVNIRSKATTHKGNQNVIGSCNKGDSFKCTGLIMDADRNWYCIVMPNGKSAYIAREFAGLENPVF